MILKPLSDGRISGTGQLKLDNRIFGGAIISADGTNAAIVSIKNDDEFGKTIFSISTKSPAAVFGPFQGSESIYYSVSGTGATAQLYEWVD